MRGKTATKLPKFSVWTHNDNTNRYFCKQRQKSQLQMHIIFRLRLLIFVFRAGGFTAEAKVLTRLK